MNLDPGSVDTQLRDWAIAFVICMVVMFWRRIFRLAEAETGEGVAGGGADSVAAKQSVENLADRKN